MLWPRQGPKTSHREDAEGNSSLKAQPSLRVLGKENVLNHMALDGSQFHTFSSGWGGGGGEGRAVKIIEGFWVFLFFHFYRIYIFMNLERLLHRMRER